MLELAAIRLTRPETSTDPAAIQARLDRLERRAATNPSPMAAPAPAPHPAEPPPSEISASAGHQAGRPATSAQINGSMGQQEDQDDPPTQAGPADAAPTPAAGPVDPQPGADSGAMFEEAPMPGAAPLGNEEPETRSPAEPTFEQFESIWPALFAGLRDLLGARRWALFRETEPAGVERSTLVVAVKHAFHLDRLVEDPAVSKIVATRAGDLLGGDVKVVFRAADASQSDSNPPPTADDSEDESVDKDQLMEAPPDVVDPLKLVEDELGGTVIEDSDPTEER